MKVSTEDLDKIISEEFFPEATNGGCIQFALALDELLGADSFPSVVKPWKQKITIHTMAVIDGVVFDATGSHGTDPKVVQNWWDGFTPEHFEWIDTTVSEEKQLELMYDGLEERSYRNYSNFEYTGPKEHLIEEYIQLIQKGFCRQEFEVPRK